MQDVSTGELLTPKYYDAMNSLFKKIARPDTVVTLNHIPKGKGSYLPGIRAGAATYVGYRYLEYLNNWQVIEGIVRAEREGFDAVTINCFLDSMMREGREVVDIPVCGPAESSYVLASMLGQGFAVVTTGRDLAASIQHNMRSYGMEGRAIKKDPVRFLEGTHAKYLDTYYNSWNLGEILPEFEKVAMQCIEDGAEVIIPGCTILSVLLATNDYSKVEGTEAPVLDPVSAEIKMAETLVDLKKKLGVELSRVSTYKSIKKIPEDVRSKIREAYGLSRV